MAATVTVTHKGQTVEATPETWQSKLDELIAVHGPYDQTTGVKWNTENAVDPVSVLTFPASNVPANSSFGGELVSDPDAQQRIAAAQRALTDAGIRVDPAQQFYATGTRMADIGYQTQHGRKREHDARVPIADAAQQLVETIKAERRQEIVLTGSEIASGLSMNGRLTLKGYKLSEHAIRGMLTRGESSAATYVFSLRDRMQHNRNVLNMPAEGDAKVLADLRTQISAQLNADRHMLLATLIREMESSPDTKYQLRARDGQGDMYATVSPSYGIADADVVLPSIVASLPADAKGTVQYDPMSTSWELRAHVWTPTPVDEQAVGEPFEAYSSIMGNDAGSGRLRGGGGIELLRCLNASTYAAIVAGLSRMHRKGVLIDLDGLVAQALKAIRTMVDIWASARLTLIHLPISATNTEQLMPIEDAIPGFMRNLLVDRRSELQAVLPGRRESHVKALSAAYFDERRDENHVTRADLANAFTRYAQDQDTFGVRRNVETQTAAWLHSNHVPSYEAA